MPRKLTSNDVAAMLDTTPDQVNLLARKGLLTGAKHGKNWKFSHGDVFAYRRREGRMPKKYTHYCEHYHLLINEKECRQRQQQYGSKWKGGRRPNADPYCVSTCRGRHLRPARRDELQAWEGIVTRQIEEVKKMDYQQVKDKMVEYLRVGALTGTQLSRLFDNKHAKIMQKVRDDMLRDGELLSTAKGRHGGILYSLPDDSPDKKSAAKSEQLTVPLPAELATGEKAVEPEPSATGEKFTPRVVEVPDRLEALLNEFDLLDDVLKLAREQFRPLDFQVAHMIRKQIAAHADHQG